MGKVLQPVHESLIDPHPDRNANLLRVYLKENGEAVIHFRNLKIMLLKHEVDEWKRGFEEAHKKFVLYGYMKNDI